MKYLIAFLFLTSSLLMITSCSRNTDVSSKSFSDNKDVQAMIDQLSGSVDSPKRNNRTETMFSVPSYSSRKADIDIASMSSSMAYSVVIDMVNNEDSYIGKTVRMSGQFATMANTDTGKRYYACRVQDATACCGQIIEFEPKGDLTYPDDFPFVGDDIEVFGVFDTYEEDGFIYCTLRYAEFVKK